AAAVTGIALPGRFDEAVRIGMVRRFRGKRTGVGALCLSLLLLGLIDSAALSPIAGIAAGVSGANGWILAGLITCSVAGVASAALPIAPAGAATQAGAGAAILIASGVHSSDALAFSVAAQALAILAGGAIAVTAIVWQARHRFVPVRVRF